MLNTKAATVVLQWGSSMAPGGLHRRPVLPPSTLLKVLIRLLKARLKVLLKVLIRLLKARLKVLLKVLRALQELW